MEAANISDLREPGRLRRGLWSRFCKIDTIGDRGKRNLERRVRAKSQGQEFYGLVREIGRRVSPKENL